MNDRLEPGICVRISSGVQRGAYNADDRVDMMNGTSGVAINNGSHSIAGSEIGFSRRSAFNTPLG